MSEIIISAIIIPVSVKVTSLIIITIITISLGIIMMYPDNKLYSHPLSIQQNE